MLLLATGLAVRWYLDRREYGPIRDAWNAAVRSQGAYGTTTPIDCELGGIPVQVQITWRDLPSIPGARIIPDLPRGYSPPPPFEVPLDPPTVNPQPGPKSNP